ncbi:protein-export chaperone SecB [Tenacibaculum finnmarkense]|uniref:Preprotein translocase subunit SecB n=1 Tax=Tenacibaculum finnmarkense genomovar finnmarkense TaxID=1458503 RepID=A0AAP1WHC0_9FLAO|nr:protein-export chaperone SecB [Tenacibaculum finnmarkense]SOS48988.1 conserved hypothetical protein [Tenacibaculum dicentrarchi]MBE7653947.1 hypothetical protein [Tenacibaculum finnmarkense genomovar finnmarkense]MBE7696248.1 hypothetical protein [Tenacibaculum finnmarkense genomovar finnmarkense]MCD8428498.1 protein-export chaperone SecB [Tenacibaculum finnmarkense genomovar finnmarkense]MCG8732268.1 hypothetical protein [Tenacibaculum finnmarkense]
MNKAAFYLDNYRFEKINIDFSKQTSNDIDISFDPKGIFNKQSSEFKLIILFSSKSGKSEQKFAEIECHSIFKFEENTNFEDIPTYFYRNSIAIIFPYIRAFISSVTLQANIPPIVLPTLNLSSLETPLKENTTQN